MFEIPKIITVTIVKWIIAWKKYIFAGLVKDQLQVSLLPANFEWDGVAHCRNVRALGRVSYID